MLLMPYELIIEFSILVDVVVLVKLIHTFRLLRVEDVYTIPADKLPTISVCIAARNEMNVLSRCLDRVVSSDYPKIEILVLDDASHDKTSLIIKSYAQSGVRFIGNRPLPEGWLGKNYAQYVLAKEASGQFVIFLDVDSLISTQSIRRLVSYAQRKHVHMLSVIPQRTNVMNLENIMTTLRHFWYVLRFTPHSLQASSSAWLIERKLLLELFASYQSLAPALFLERKLSRLVAQDHTYRLLQSQASLGIYYDKKWSSQIETNIRLLYADCDTSIMQSAFIIFILGLFLSPYVILWLSPMALAAIFSHLFICFYYMSVSWPKFRLVAMVWLPITVLQEIWLLCLSFYHNTRGSVVWKERPVAYFRATDISKTDQVK